MPVGYFAERNFTIFVFVVATVLSVQLPPDSKLNKVKPIPAPNGEKDKANVPFPDFTKRIKFTAKRSSKSAARLNLSSPYDETSKNLRAGRNSPSADVQGSIDEIQLHPPYGSFNENTINSNSNGNINVISGKVNLYHIFIGSEQPDYHDQNEVVSSLQDFASGLDGSTYADILSTYPLYTSRLVGDNDNGERAKGYGTTASTQFNFKGNCFKTISEVDPDTAQTPTGGKCLRSKPDSIILTDLIVQNAISNCISTNAWPEANNTQNSIFTVVFKGNFEYGNDWTKYSKAFCGFHTVLDNRIVAVIGDPTAATNVGGCLTPIWPANCSQIANSVVNTYAHELFEAVTDPSPTLGYYGERGEIGEYCDWTFDNIENNSYNIQLSNQKKFLVQDMWVHQPPYSHCDTRTIYTWKCVAKGTNEYVGVVNTWWGKLYGNTSLSHNEMILLDDGINSVYEDDTIAYAEGGGLWACNKWIPGCFGDKCSVGYDLKCYRTDTQKCVSIVGVWWGNYYDGSYIDAGTWHCNGNNPEACDGQCVAVPIPYGGSCFDGMTLHSKFNKIPNFDFFGYEITGGKAVISLLGASNACTSYNSCLGYNSWGYIKYALRSPTIPTAGIQSKKQLDFYVSQVHSNSHFLAVADFNSPENNMGHFHISESFCASICRSKSGCVGFVISFETGKSECWLKRSFSSPVKDGTKIMYIPVGPACPDDSTSHDGGLCRYSYFASARKDVGDILGNGI